MSKQQDMALSQLTHRGDEGQCLAINLLQLHHHATTGLRFIVWEEDDPVSCLHRGLRGRLHT